jgi:uncharacterized protein YfaS (alpha-2-macroglobulin family)
MPRSHRSITRPRTALRLAALLGLPLACTQGQPTPQPKIEPTAPVALDLWAGLPPLELREGDLARELLPVAGPALPASVSEKIQLPFPPPQPPPLVPPVAAAPGPLKVLRYGPTGAQTLVDSLSIVFDQPMVPLASVADLRLEAPPFTLDPQPPGKLRWLGTEALTYEAEGRFPYSTTYTVKVPAGARSTLGGALAKELRWTFTTPALELERAEPYHNSVGALLDAPIVLRFNQKIRREQLAAALTFTAGGAAIPLTVVPEAEWPQLPDNTRYLTGQGPKDRLLVLRPRGPLAANTKHTLTIPAGAYGEGPNRGAAIKHVFTTYPPLTLSGPSCSSWECSPTGGLYIAATTPLAPADLSAKVRVTPEVPNLKITASHGIYLTGEFEGDATYTITVDPGIADIHGQRLAKPYTARVKVNPVEPSLTLAAAHRDPAVIETGAARRLMLAVGGVTTLDVRARPFGLDELPKMLANRWFNEDRTWPEELPPPTYSGTEQVQASRRRPLRLGLDLAPMLAPGKVLLLALRSSPFTRWGYTSRLTHVQPVQVTDLGITSALDNNSGVLLVTSIERGEPLAGVDLELLDTSNNGVRLWSGRTGADGLAEVKLASLANTDLLVTAKRGDDVAYMPLSEDITGRWWNRWDVRESEPRAFFYSDRQPYKPGETIHLAGVLRSEERKPAGGVALWHTDFKAKYTLTSPRGAEIAKGELPVGPLGAFNLDLPIPEGSDLGDYTFNLEVGGWFSTTEYFTHTIAVEAYRAPEFEVAVERGEAAPLVFGDTLRAEIRGAYLHGAPLVGGEVSYTLRRQSSGFSPAGPENVGFTFGRGWADPWSYRHLGLGLGGQDVLVAQGSGTLEADGKWPVEHVLKVIEKDLNNPDAPAPAPDPDPPVTAAYTLEGQVTDKNRQAIAGRSTYVVHPALHYAGLRADRTVYRKGEQAKVEAVVVDLDGHRLSGRPLEITLQREVTERKAVEKDGVWTYEYSTEQIRAGSCAPVSGPTPVTCDLSLEQAGAYTLRAAVTDEQGRKSLTTTTLYVHGDDAVIWDQDQRRVDLVPDRRSYEPGAEATLLVRSPFDRARGLLILERSGIVEHRPITVEGGSAAIKLTIPETAVPNLHVAVVLVRGRVDVPGAPPGQDLGRPAHAAGTVDLQVSSAKKRLTVELAPERDELAPKDTLRLGLTTRGADGKARPAAVALMVVDEGVLSLLGYKTPDPLAFFHRPREGGAGIYDLRSFLLGRDEPPKAPEPPPPPAPSAPGEPTPDSSGHFRATPYGGAFAAGNDDADVWGGLTGTEVGEAYGVGGLGLVGYGRGGGGTGVEMKTSSKIVAEAAAPAALDARTAMANPVSLRALFATTAYWNPEVRTDADGRATVEIPMPENLTTFRIMAVAIDPEEADRFGSADATVRVRKPIMLRPSLPRFANFGDKFEASVMVDNQTREPQAVLVGARALGVTFTGDGQQTLEIPAGESRELRFPITIDQVGRLRMQFAALANLGRDAAEVTIPINLPVTRQAFADYGVTDASIARAIKAPQNALPGYGGLELSLASTALTGLEDAASYLITYAYECTEQVASRILPIVLLGPILDSFKIEGAGDKASRDALIKEGVQRLIARQNGDGGFRYWDNPSRSWPYLATWVTFALLEAKRGGAQVDQPALDRAMRYLQRYIDSGEETGWGRYYDHTSRTFALWLLSREGRGADSFDRVWANRSKLPLYAEALLMSAAHKYGRTRERDQVRKSLLARAREDARVARFVESKSEGDADGLQLLMHSDVQTDAIALMALLEINPADPLLPKVMASIMDDRDPKRGGRWLTTHANAWALLAADRYFQTVEKQPPDYVARIWLDQSYAGEQQFRGRSMAVTEQTIPMARLQAAPEQTLTLAKEGPGKLYYRLGLRYAPAELKVAPEAQGFVVYRTYEAVGQGAEKPPEGAVRQLEDGTWQIKAGTTVKVNLTLVAKDRANFVVVDDPLPAGLEGQNSRFQTTLQDLGARVSFGEGGAPQLFFRSSGARPWIADWWYPWWTWDHTELRDDRLLLFADRLPAGIYTYSYIARATTIGDFVLPPIHAEGMYTPERFGHSASGRVVITE